MNLETSGPSPEEIGLTPQETQTPVSQPKTSSEQSGQIIKPEQPLQINLENQIAPIENLTSPELQTTPEQKGRNFLQDKTEKVMQYVGLGLFGAGMLMSTVMPYYLELIGKAPGWVSLDVMATGLLAMYAGSKGMLHK